MDRPSMEDSPIIRRYKQRLAEKRAEAEKKTTVQEEQPEQIDFDKFMNGHLTNECRRFHL